MTSTAMHETTNADDVTIREPLAHAYAHAWAEFLGYRLVVSDAWTTRYGPPTRLPKGYFEPHIVAGRAHVFVTTPVHSFSIYFHTEPVTGKVSCSVGMRGEAIDEDMELGLLISVKDLPYSTMVGTALMDRMDWLNKNPMYRGLPGVASRQRLTPAQSVDEGKTRPKDWE